MKKVILFLFIFLLITMFSCYSDSVEKDINTKNTEDITNNETTNINTKKPLNKAITILVKLSK
jgi:Na+-transporting methylmalonyl-CoA/oxaloacetate decarboxylase gamma subunit